MSTRGTKIVVWLIVAALVLGGLGTLIATVAGGGSGSTAVPSPQPLPQEPGADKAPDQAVQNFYGQELTWEKCRKKFVCSELVVPLDYSKPTGETLSIAVLRVPASGDRLGSLVVNPGGPGASGLDYAEGFDYSFGEALHERYDIVGFDPRGVGQSTAIDCLSDDELAAYMKADPDPDTAAEESESFATGSAFGKACVKNSGALAAHVSTEEAARDMDVLRSALGENQLTYFGASYGTKLGATYADLFPANVGRFVLDGAVDPALSSLETNLGQAAGFQTALDAYLEDCLSGPNCFLGATLDEGRAKVAGLLEQLDKKPLATSDGRGLSEGEAFYGIALPLYSRDYWDYLSDGLKDAAKGDGDMLQLLSDSYAGREGDTFADNSMEAIFAINCLDDPWAVRSADEVTKLLPRFEKASPTFGRIFAWMTTGCAGLAVETDSAPRPMTAQGAAPIVVIGTTRDPATPVQWAESLAQQLASGVLITRDGDGHTGYNAGNDCVDDAVEKYLIDGVVPQDNLSC